MDEDTASRFVASLVKSIQALCNGYIEFSTSIEVIGHIHLNIDRNCKFNYVLSEEVNKSVSEGSTIFSSHSYHSHPPSSLVPVKASSSVESAKGTHRKSQSVPSVHQGDTAAVTSLQKEVTVSHKDTQKINDYTPQTSLSDRLSESGDSSHSGKFSLNLTYESSSAQSGRLPQTSSTGTPNSAHSKLTSHNQDPLDRRRKAQTEVQTRRTVEPSPKRTRANDSGLGTQDSGFEVIEIKEEPSLEEPCVFFADSNSQIPMGQGDLSSGASRLSGWKKDTITNDLNQTPDFSKSVMESLERVGQLEGASLINPVDAQIQLQQQPLQQDQPFPVMLHANSAAQASSVALPGTSNQQGSAPSTSGDRRVPEDLFSLPSPACRATIGMYKQYTADDMDAAIEAVHMGTPVAMAANQHGVPRRTLTHRLGHCTRGHPGKCLGAYVREQIHNIQQFKRDSQTLVQKEAVE